MPLHDEPALPRGEAAARLGRAPDHRRHVRRRFGQTRSHAPRQRQSPPRCARSKPSRVPTSARVPAHCVTRRARHGASSSSANSAAQAGVSAAANRRRRGSPPCRDAVRGDLDAELIAFEVLRQRDADVARQLERAYQFSQALFDRGELRIAQTPQRGLDGLELIVASQLHARGRRQSVAQRTPD